MALLCLCTCLDGKIFSAPCTKTLWELKEPSVVHLRAFGHFWKEYWPFGQEKQTLSSELCFALCVGAFPRKTRQCHKGCVSLQSMQLIGFVGRALPPTVGGSALDVEADTFSDAFFFVVSGEISLNSGFSEVTLFSLELLLGLYPVVQF